jgi:hypothetical protein
MPFTPETLEEGVVVNYSRVTILGLSHELLQYSHTSSHRFEGLEFFFRGTTEEEVEQIHEGRRFLLHLCYAPLSPEGIRDGGPPRVLFYWPEVVSLTCVLEDLRISHLKFNLQGRTTVFRARVSLTEVRDVRIDPDDVRVIGTQRSTTASEGV